PVVVLAAIVGCSRLVTLTGIGRSSIRPVVALLALFATGLAYRQAGAGPLADGFTLPPKTAHHELADRLLRKVPPGARVSASSSLEPHLSQRQGAFLFPTVSDADYVALDVSATSFPVSPGDVFLRATSLMGDGEWTTLEARDGLLLLARQPALSQPLPANFFSF